MTNKQKKKKKKPQSNRKKVPGAWLKFQPTPKPGEPYDDTNLLYSPAFPSFNNIHSGPKYGRDPTPDQVRYKILLAGWFHRQSGGNSYFALEAFNVAVSNEANPPIWALQALNDGVARQLAAPDPKRLARDLGLKGRAVQTYRTFENGFFITQDYRMLRNNYKWDDTNGTAAFLHRKYGEKMLGSSTLKNYKKKYEEIFDSLNVNLHCSTTEQYESFEATFPRPMRVTLKRNRKNVRSTG